MTANQINYWKLQEDRRSNLAKETEANRHNIVTEGETSRHNVATEQVSLGNLQETSRHNTATEQETVRHNTATEAESQRHNVASERFNISQLEENKRHNLSQEQLAGAENIIDRYKADIQKAYNNAIVELRSQELNLSQEKELKRIEESKRDFDEAVRYHDLQAAINALNSGSNAISKLSGTSALVPVAAGGVGATMLRDAVSRSRKQPLGLPGPVSEYTKTSPHLWLIPEFMLELQKINTIGPTSSNSGLKVN